ncbi:glycoside hydrolase family 3 protein, partial [Aspergillus carbonarius ITEM 5010]
GSHVFLGPVAGPLGRSALGGRNWEGFPPDPYLTGELFTETLLSIQDGGVQACAKHYIGNEQETQRQSTQNGNGTTIESVSSNSDDLTLHELYLWPFQQAVRAGVAAVMCSYNRLNQTYGCQNSKTLNGLLKSELGFQGYVMSDWGATHSGVFAVNSGQDMDMAGTASFGPVFFHQKLTTSVNNGSVSIDRLDDMCRRVMTPYFHLHQDKGFPAIDPSNKELNALLFSSPNEYKYNYTYGTVANVDGRGDHGAAIRKQAAEGTVLLKNVNGTLPLKSPKQIAVFGNDAGDFTNGMSIFYLNGVGTYEYGVLAAGGGTGSGLFSYVVSPLEAIKQRAGFRKATLVQYVLNNTAIIEEYSPYLAAVLPSPPDVCLVFLKSWATEEKDRTTLHSDWEDNQVVERITSQYSNTIMMTHSNRINILPWANHPNITTILTAHFPRQKAGNSIINIL